MNKWIKRLLIVSAVFSCLLFGFHLTPEIAFNRISIFFKLGAEFSFFILSKNPWSIGVNIVALGLFIYLLRIKKLIIK